MRRLALGLLALLLLACVQQPSAALAIFWRAAVVSWDSPVTQWQDELACQGAAWTDPQRQAQRHLTTPGPCRRLPVASSPGVPTAAVRDADHSRSPPRH